MSEAKTKAKEFNHWFCEKHDAGPMEHHEFLAHLKEHHGLDAAYVLCRVVESAAAVGP